MRASTAVLLVCWLGVASCGRVGREIVGEIERPIRPLTAECMQVRPCGAFTPDAPESVPDAAGPIDLHACPLTELPGCSDPSTQNGRGSACGTAGDFEPEQLGWSQDAVGSRTCSALSVVRDESADAAPLVARSVSVRDVNLRFESVAEATVEFDESELAHVWFDLHGPISLRLIRNRSLDDIRINADDAAQIAIEGADASALSVAADSGSVSMRRVSVRGARVAARATALESVALRDGIFEGASFEATDSTLRRVEVRAERTLLSSSDVSAGDFDACRTLTTVQGFFTDVHVAACDEPTRLNGTSVESSRLDGALVLDGAKLARTEVGQPDAAPLELWDAALRVVSFCGDRQKVSLAGASQITCPRCDLASQPVMLHACYATGADIGFEEISSCQELVDAPGCAPLDPVRMRPSRQ